MGDVKTLLGNPISHLQHTPSYVRTAEELLQDVDELHVACMQLQALLAERVYEVEVRGIELDASSTKRYVAERLQLKQATAGRLLDLGHTLSARPTLAEAVHAGTVNVELVPIIAGAVQTIEGVAPAATLDEAERFLIGQVARGLSPTQLAQCGEAILHHVAPELADGFDEDRRRREEEKADRRREFSIGPAVHGSHRIHGWLDTETAAGLHTALDPLARRRATVDGIVDERSRPERYADALAEMIRLYAAGEHGAGTQVVVTINYQHLQHGRQPGRLDTGQPVSAETARRMACDAKLIPVVLGGAGQVLDVGRARRLFDGPLRSALEVRDAGCTFPGCGRGPKYTDAHHITSWWAGGDTSLTNGILLCLPHHKEIHRGHWRIHMTPHGIPEFVPPIHIDPQQRPMRNHIARR